MTELERRMEELEPLLTAALQRVVRIRSVRENDSDAPFGSGPRECLREALKIAGELGFRTHDMQDYCGWAEYGEGEEMAMILGHLDVVPEGEGWDEPPYGAVIRDGKIFGRGTTDDKGPVMAALYALKAVADAGIPLKRRVRLVFGCAEETGSEDMEYYREHGGEIPAFGFTPDAEYPLINGEKGIIIETYEHPLGGDGPARLILFEGGIAANVTPDHARAVVECADGTELPPAERIILARDGARWIVEAEGKAAHGSVPEEGENALGRLALYLARLPLRGADREAITFLAEKIGMEVHGESLGCCLKDELSGYLSNNWGVACMRPGGLSVTLNYRYPVTFGPQDCMPAVHSAFEQAGWNRVAEMHEPKLYTPEDHPLVQTLLKVYREETGDMRPPKCIGGGTYAKALPNIVAFGPVFPGDEVTEHLPNETIRLDRLYRNMRIYAKAIVEMANM